VQRKPKLSIRRHPASLGSQQTHPILLVHGAWHGAWCWEGGFVDSLNNAGFDCFTVDLRGHGDSKAITQMRWNRIADYVEDVISALEQIDGNPIMVGHSMGGFVCQHVRERYRNLSGICLLASAPHYGVFPMASRTMKKHPLTVFSTFAKLSLKPLINSKARVREMFLDADTPDANAEAFRLKLIDESFVGFLDMLALDLPPKPTINVPTLVIGGARDPLFPPHSQYALARRYGAECHIIEDAPHNLMNQKNWQKAARVLTDWAKTLA